MTPDHRTVTEQRVAEWLDGGAPQAPPDLAARLLAGTESIPQRGRSPLSGLFLVRAAVAAAVVAGAILIGLGLATVIGPQPPVGTSQPVGTSPAATETPPTAAPPRSSDATGTPSATTVPPRAEPGRIAFQADRGNGTSGIYVMDADGSNVVELVDDPGVHELDPIWSPDGALVAYITMSADGTMQGGTFIVRAEDGEPVLVDGNYPYGPAEWSPDGAMLATGGDGSERGIGVYHVAEGELEALTDDGGFAPHWSPDGSRIAYNVRGDIRVVDVVSGEVTAITDDLMEWNDSVGRWTPDGERLIFGSDRDADQTRESARSWIVDADGGEPELLGDSRLIAFAHWPSPDGEWLAYAASDGSGLRLSRADGSQDRAVHRTIPADQGPSWATDSRAFVFSTARDAARDILLMRVGAAEPEPITDHPADESAPNWGPPGS